MLHDGRKRTYDDLFGPHDFVHQKCHAGVMTIRMLVSGQKNDSLIDLDARVSRFPE